MSDVKATILPRFDLWVCRGRMCTANGANDLAAACEAAVANEFRIDEGGEKTGFAVLSTSEPLEGRVGKLPHQINVQRGGCYGLCDLGPNVVVRRHLDDAGRVHTAADRLTLTGADNESVYCGVEVADVADVVHAHVVDDAPLVRLSRATREQQLTPTTEIERRMRALRAMRERRNP